MPLPDDALTWELLQALRDCLCSELAGDVPTGGCCIVPGETAGWALPFCCDLAWVRLVRVFPTGNFPQPAPAVNAGCPGVTGWAADIELGVARCMPVMDDQGNPPSCAEMEASARREYADMAATRRAVLCCDWRATAGMPADQRYLIRTAVPFGPEGQCGGSTLTITIELCGSVCGG